MTATTGRKADTALKIAFISQWYPPESTPLPADIVAGLVERGHAVKVVTTLPNYPSGVVHSEYRNGRRRREKINGVEVFRVPSYPSHDSSGFRRALTFASFAVSVALNPGPAIGADVVLVYGTPLTAAAPALWVRLSYGTPFVVQVQDLWPESVIASGMIEKTKLKGFVSTLVGSYAKTVYRVASGVIGITESMTRELVRRGAAAATASTVYNWSIREQGANRTRGKREKGPLRLLYAGNVGVMQDVETIVRAVGLVEQTRDVEFTIVGDGVRLRNVKQIARQLGVQSVKFVPRVSADEMEEFYQDTDFSFVSLVDEPFFRLNLPSKFQASLARGVPVITTVAGAAAEICQIHGCGIVAEPQNVNELAAAIVRASYMSGEELNAMSINAEVAARRLFAREGGIRRIEESLNRATEHKKRRSIHG